MGLPNPNRPSLFELLAEEQLRDLFHPVVRYVLSVGHYRGIDGSSMGVFWIYFAQRYPQHLVQILHSHNEVYAILLLLLERHHLKKYNASVSEHFYQLHHVQAGGLPTPRLNTIEPRRNGRLNRKQQWGLLVFLVVLPYIRTKAQQYFETMRNEDDSASPETTTQRTYKRVYPYINLGLDLSLLSYDIAYLFDKTDSYRPWHTWLGLRIERKGPNDIPTSNSSFLSRLPPLLPPLLLLLKVSQWWYSPSSPRSLPVPQTSTTNHNLIPPPKPLQILPGADIYPSVPAEDEEKYTIEKVDFGKCPLCRRKWQNPAILESGWVVCWRCGWDAIQGDELEEDWDGKGKCPITGVPVSRTDLRRVLL